MVEEGSQQPSIVSGDVILSRWSSGAVLLFLSGLHWCCSLVWGGVSTELFAGAGFATAGGRAEGDGDQACVGSGWFYPGTPHNYSVYVPAQYDVTKATPFMVFLDGSGYLGEGIRAQVVLDNLIAKHEVPPMIGIFIDSGVLPAIAPDAQSRFERVFEYDSLSERYSWFLLEELIPAVAKEYNLSRNPDDRGIAGTSTGAVGAFVAGGTGRISFIAC